LKYVEAPEDHPYNWREWRIFLAGGITNCPDWQQTAKELISKWKNTEGLVVVNPRRKDFDINDISVSERQIEWEWQNLRDSDLIIFWFCADILQPITLFELGKYSGHEQAAKRIIVGTHPDYPRAFDVRKQLALEHEYEPIVIVDSLEELVELAQVKFRDFQRAHYNFTTPQRLLDGMSDKQRQDQQQLLDSLSGNAPTLPREQELERQRLHKEFMEELELRGGTMWEDTLDELSDG